MVTGGVLSLQHDMTGGKRLLSASQCGPVSSKGGVFFAGEWGG